MASFFVRKTAKNDQLRLQKRAIYVAERQKLLDCLSVDQQTEFWDSEKIKRDAVAQGERDIKVRFTLS